MANKMDFIIDTQAVQIVDGNGFLLDRLRSDFGGFVPRDIIEDVRRCRRPPIFVFDGRGGNARRRERFPPYKSNRAKPGEDLFASVNFVKELLGYMPVVSITCEGWEADDVIASMVIGYAKTGQKVRIMTTDRDLYQLAALPNVEITCSYENVEPRYVRLFKTFSGDPSDGIPGIKSFGPKAWEAVNYAAGLRLMSSPTCEPHLLEAVGFKPGHALWVQENFDLLRSMWDVIGLLEVPIDEFKAGMKVGMHKPNLMEERLREFQL